MQSQAQVASCGRGPSITVGNLNQAVNCSKYDRSFLHIELQASRPAAFSSSMQTGIGIS
ncbi:hypothetical protein BDR03DRAFT_949043 [Suillus americanus]|nr:hypothetical protein BDR03DRAFT_949043 [Suillus americanus]